MKPGRAILEICLLVAALSLGCSQEQDEGMPPLSQHAPLQPLIYTEFPNLTPEAAAVRERRLMRQLREGSSASGQWGMLEVAPTRSLPRLSEPEDLGKALFEALSARDDELWEHVFVRPAAYAQLVHLDLEAAREFVDDQQGRSFPTWQLFQDEGSSESREEGLAGVFTFEGITLGQGRTVEGPVANEHDHVAQYWHNIISLRFKDTDVLVELTIPKVLRVHDPDQPGQFVLGVASEVRADRKLQLLLEMGIHLKPELLRSREYPLPLEVGNFWRYRRYNAVLEKTEGDLDPFDDLAQLGSARLDATEVLVEVESVDRYDTLRMVQIGRSYNDLSLYREHWLVTPRRIYLCNRLCRRQVPNLAWLLEYFTHQTPIYRFPLIPGGSWRVGGRDGQDKPVFAIDDQWHTLEVAAGTFHAAVGISGTGPLGDIDPHYATPGLRRFFSPGNGVIKQIVWSKDKNGEPVEIVEELIEFRLMP